MIISKITKFKELIKLKMINYCLFGKMHLQATKIIMLKPLKWTTLRFLRNLKNINIYLTNQII